MGSLKLKVPVRVWSKVFTRVPFQGFFGGSFKGLESLWFTLVEHSLRALS